jgi:hypothetical protein
MGDYTGIRFRAKIKPEYKPLLHMLLKNHDNWRDILTWFPKYTFIKPHLETARADSIPYGGLTVYMPEEWEGDPNFNFYADTVTLDMMMEERILAFQCDVKFSSSIYSFLNHIAATIVDETYPQHIETYYEYHARSVFHEVKDGKLVESTREGILYNSAYEDDDEWMGYGGYINDEGDEEA